MANYNNNNKNNDNEILNTYIKNYKNNLFEEINEVIENIKYQNGFNELIYKVNEFIIISNILDEVNIEISSKKINLNNIKKNTIYININPLTLILSNNCCSTLNLINMINKHISSLFFKNFENLLIDLLSLINNKENIIIQNNYICKQFYQQIKHLPIKFKFT